MWWELEDKGKLTIYKWQISLVYFLTAKSPAKKEALIQVTKATTYLLHVIACVYLYINGLFEAKG